jgi:hypothetical protein
MKTKLIIKKNGSIQDQPYLFDDQVILDNFLSMIETNGTFGPKEQVIQHPEIPAIPEVLVTPAVFDSQGVEISPMIPGSPTVDAIAAYTEVIPGYTVELVDITAELAEKARLADLKLKGAEARIACEECLDLIAGHNISANLSSDQITSMSVLFAPIVQALMLNRPSLAKSLISVIVPDGIIVTDQLKADVLADLVRF